jgi:NAD(P)H dehydrogenase (quinone)
MGAAPDATFTLAREHFRSEEAIRATGLGFTFSRQSIYLDVLPFMAADGLIRGPAGDGRFAPVARDDVADSLVAMLTYDGHDGRTYQLTGPRTLTMADIAREISEATGDRVTFQNETLEEARASRAHYRAPDWEVEGWVTSYAAIAAGEMDVVTDTVRELTGHEPIGVPEYLRSGAVG